MGITIWVDGGWGVDALIGTQTRRHQDLDIAIQEQDVTSLRTLLTKRGYKQIRESSKWNFVLSDDVGHEIDVHSFVFDATGNVVDGIVYPAASLTGMGDIDGHSVRCIAPEYVVKFHSGYELKEKDFKDVSAICEKFGIDLPQQYAHLKK
jgi:lincosamide nucleotidyltransferase A/C/D/E